MDQSKATRTEELARHKSLTFEQAEGAESLPAAAGDADRDAMAELSDDR
jgi:hypothetical protein